ncbi:hypothetical protein ENSA5_59560 [Enhygromyxa salina]|uniref:Uncharacterized protein n=1 Tax=Enhygromyxa salina TaxID=215803 RepID=A0A2S9XDW9_9BACT|nr:hypothetical protein ENSA5_59560 [Enhygromyxa salina]
MKGLKHRLTRLSRHPRPGIHNTKLPARPHPAQLHDDLGPSRRELDRVVQQVVQSLADRGRREFRRRLARVPHADQAPALLGQRPRSVNGIDQDRNQIPAPTLDRARAQRGQIQQAARQIREPGDLDEGVVQRLAQLARGPLAPERDLDPRAHRRERGPQLMGRVGDQAILARARGREPLGRLGDRPTQLADLVGLRIQRRRRVEVAGPEPPHVPRQVADALAQAARVGDLDREQGQRGEHDDEGGDAPVLAHLAIVALERGGEPQRVGQAVGAVDADPQLPLVAGLGDDGLEPRGPGEPGRLDARGDRYILGVLADRRAVGPVQRPARGELPDLAVERRVDQVQVRRVGAVEQTHGLDPGLGEQRPIVLGQEHAPKREARAHDGDDQQRDRDRGAKQQQPRAELQADAPALMSSPPRGAESRRRGRP